jgi:hypothetical protein
MREGKYSDHVYQKYIMPEKKSFAESVAQSLQLQAELNDERIVRKLTYGNLISIKNTQQLVNALKQRKVR